MELKESQRKEIAGIQTVAQNIGDYGCLAFCYALAAKILTDDENINSLQLLKDVAAGVKMDIIDCDCFVKDAESYLYFLTNKHFKVDRLDLPDNDYSKLKLAAVRFDYNGFSHWVLIKDGKIAFDSLTSSNCVKHGKPTTARLISLA